MNDAEPIPGLCQSRCTMLPSLHQLASGDCIRVVRGMLSRATFNGGTAPISLPSPILVPPLHQYRLHRAAWQHSSTGYRIAALLVHLVTMTPDSVVGQFIRPRAIRHWPQFTLRVRDVVFERLWICVRKFLIEWACVDEKVCRKTMKDSVCDMTWRRVHISALCSHKRSRIGRWHKTYT